MRTAVPPALRSAVSGLPSSVDWSDVVTVAAVVRLCITSEPFSRVVIRKSGRGVSYNLVQLGVLRTPRTSPTGNGRGSLFGCRVYLTPEDGAG